MNPYTSPNSKVSNSDQGYLFNFTIGQDLLVIDCTSLVGLLRIYYNKSLIYKKREFGRKSFHEFTANGINYRLELEVTDVAKGILECKLFSGDRLLKHSSAIKYSKNDMPTLFVGLPIVFITLVSVVYFDYSRWFVVLAVFLMIIVMRVRSLKNVTVIEGN